MRALWLHYPGDPRARAVGDEYLWGRDILVAPVYEKGAVRRSLYLPPGTWYDWWTGERLEGGQRITRNADLATLPLFVRAGAVIPLDPLRQYVAEPVPGPTTLRVFPGADGEFTLYEDEGDNLKYLSGAGTRIPFRWDDSRRTLIVGARSGSYPGMSAERTFQIVAAAASPEAGPRPVEVRYSGRETQVRIGE
jgi:alpha-glucosidase/alpha-D-xyloside xylohydrolase